MLLPCRKNFLQTETRDTDCCWEAKYTSFDIKPKNAKKRGWKISQKNLWSLQSASRDTLPYPYIPYVLWSQIVSGCLGETADLMEVEREITYRKKREEDQAMSRSITEQRSPYLVLQTRRDEGREAGMERGVPSLQKWMLRQSDGEERKKRWTDRDSWELISEEIWISHMKKSSYPCD